MDAASLRNASFWQSFKTFKVASFSQLQLIKILLYNHSSWNYKFSNNKLK